MKRHTMDRIWLAAPSPAMRVWKDAERPGWRINAAARAWGERVGVAPTVWPAMAVALIEGQKGPHPATGRLETPKLHWQSVPLAAGWLVWLTPPNGGDVWDSADDKLALVQEFGAIGVFERNLRTREARWDAQVFRLFGLDPASDRTPDFDGALARVHPDDRERFRTEHERFVREGGRHGLRYRVVLPDASTRDLQSLVEVRRDAQGVPLRMIGVIVDDSDAARRARAQEAITAHLARALQLARVSVWRMDSANRRIHFNDVGYELIGVAPRADGIDVDELRSWAHPDDRPALVRAAQEAVAGGKVIDVEARYASRNGETLHLLTRRVAERDAAGQVVGLLGITIDQTANVAERERARALSRRIELVAEAAELGIWSIELASDKVEWNAEMCRIYGLPETEPPATAREWVKRHIHPDDHAALRELQRRERQGLATSFEIRMRIVRPDGSTRWVVSRSRLEQRDGAAFVIGVHLDLTELIEQREIAERAIGEKELALRASQAKSDFLARVSHELRTPLNAVLGFSQLIEHDAGASAAPLQRERLARIRLAGEHLLALVDDVLDLAAIEAGNLPIAIEPVAIDAVLGDVAQWLATPAESAQVTLHVEPSGGHVRADARRLRQMISNLVSNAIKFNHAGGHVWLSARAEGEGSAARWCVSVRDDGRGVAPGQRDKLFDAFDRLGAERDGVPGVGLGLTIVRRLAEFMGGSIDVNSAAGEGSEFRVRLDAAVPPPRVEPPAPQPDAPLTVLYIEDNHVNVILVQELIRMRPGMVLHCAETGAAGVAAALTYRPELVLIDMQLPDFDGFEVLRRLRAEPSLGGSLLVALSANTHGDDIARARESGFDDYWTKPINLKQFLGAMDTLVAQLRSVD